MLYYLVPAFLFALQNLGITMPGVNKELDNQTFILYNKEFEKARLAMWKEDAWGMGT